MELVRVAVVVVAAGPGTRLGADRPKAFVELAGRPLLAHALDSIDRAARDARRGLHIGQVVLVVPASHLDGDAAWRRAGSGDVEVRVVAGGRRRQDSVRAGLAVCSGDVVAVHDAARPFVTAATFANVVVAATEHGAAIAALPAVDTVKIADEAGDVVATPPRDRVWLAQTPQAFRRELLLAAHAAAGEGDSTDDAALVESYGAPVRVVPGDRETRKITTPDDLRWAEWLLASGQWPR